MDKILVKKVIAKVGSDEMVYCIFFEAGKITTPLFILDDVQSLDLAERIENAVNGEQGNEGY